MSMQVLWLPDGVVATVGFSGKRQLAFPLTAVADDFDLGHKVTSWEYAGATIAINAHNPVGNQAQKVSHWQAGLGADLGQIQPGSVAALFGDAWEDWNTQSALIGGQISRGGRQKARDVVVPIHLIHDPERELRRYARTKWNGLGSFYVHVENVRRAEPSTNWDNPTQAYAQWRRGFGAGASTGFLALTITDADGERPAGTTRIIRARITDVALAIDSDPTAERWEVPGAVTFTIDEPTWQTIIPATPVPSGASGVNLLPLPTDVQPFAPTYPQVRVTIPGAMSWPSGSGFRCVVGGGVDAGSEWYRMVATSAIALPSAGTLVFETSPRGRGLFFEPDDRIHAVTKKASRLDYSDKVAITGTIEPLFGRQWDGIVDGYVGHRILRHPTTQAQAYTASAPTAATRPF